MNWEGPWTIYNIYKAERDYFRSVVDLPFMQDMFKIPDIKCVG